MKFVAMVGDDGMRPVVWGLGAAATLDDAREDAREDARDWLPDGGDQTLTAHEVSAEVAMQIEQNIIDAVELGIVIT